jgi:hypothetical protein
MAENTFITEGILLEPKKQNAYLIIESDWVRIKKMVGRITPNRRYFEIVSSSLFGICASSVFSIFSLNSADNVANWVTVVSWVILITSLICGIGLYYLSNEHKDIIDNSADDVIDEMNLIEESFHKPLED